MKINFREFYRISKTVGLMTAQNPHGKDLSGTDSGKSKNASLNKAFLLELRKRGYEPIGVDGSYGGADEKSFLIPGIDREELIELGEKYNQQAVIWGRRTAKGMRFEWIEGSKTKRVRTVPEDSDLSIPF